MWRPPRSLLLVLMMSVAALVFAAACDDDETDLGDAFDTATPEDGGGTTPTPGAAATRTPTQAAAATRTPAAGTPQTGGAAIQQQLQTQIREHGLIGAMVQLVEDIEVTEFSLDFDDGEVIVVSDIEEEQAEGICDRIEEFGLFIFGSVRFENQDGDEVATCEVDEVTRIDVDVEAHEVTVETTWGDDDDDRAQNLCDVLSQSRLFGEVEGLTVRILDEDGDELATCGGAAGSPTPTRTPSDDNNDDDDNDDM